MNAGVEAGLRPVKLAVNYDDPQIYHVYYSDEQESGIPRGSAA